ncbi:MAG TPA: HAD family hydrolase [Ktedonobacteraceae bacterium]|nr:HAD family hydrolase [Ktedonobacteraceae bacterium]
MLKQSIRCLLFDLGGTLWKHGEEGVTLVYERAANLYALAHLRRIAGNNVFAGVSEMEAGAQLRKVVERAIRVKTRENPLYEPDFAQAATEALQTLGIPNVTTSLGGMIYEALRVRSVDSRLLFEDAIQTLATLKARGYTLGVVTNRHYGGEPFHQDLCEMGLLDYFDYNHMAISADLGIRKPQPGIFTHALNGLCVTPAETAMVGDSLKADIAGAKALNITAIWKPYRLHRNRRDAEEDGIVPDRTIVQLKDLLDLF